MCIRDRSLCSCFPQVPFERAGVVGAVPNQGTDADRQVQAQSRLGREFRPSRKKVRARCVLLSCAIGQGVKNSDRAGFRGVKKLQVLLCCVLGFQGHRHAALMRGCRFTNSVRVLYLCAESTFYGARYTCGTTRAGAFLRVELWDWNRGMADDHLGLSLIHI